MANPSVVFERIVNLFVGGSPPKRTQNLVFDVVQKKRRRKKHDDGEIKQHWTLVCGPCADSIVLVFIETHKHQTDVQ